MSDHHMMSHPVAKVPEAEVPAPAREPDSILAVIERAARDPNVDIAKWRELVQMRREEEDRAASRAYAAALSRMQPDLPVITKRGHIDIGRGKPQPYARWEDINEAIKPILARHGFVLWFDISQPDDKKVEVTAVLGHGGGGGHSERTSLRLPLDTSGSKNPVQAHGSTVSYGKRYTAGALLNLTARGEDDDGNGAGHEPISDEQLAELQTLIDEVGADIPKFCRYLGIERIADLPAAKFGRALQALHAKGARQ